MYKACHKLNSLSKLIHRDLIKKLGNKSSPVSQLCLIIIRRVVFMWTYVNCEQLDSNSTPRYLCALELYIITVGVATEVQSSFRF